MTKTEILNKVNNLPYEGGKGPFNVSVTDYVIVYNKKVAYGFWNVKDDYGNILNCVCQMFPKYKDMEIEDIPEDLSNLRKEGELEWFDESEYYNEYGGVLLAIKKLNNTEL